MPDDIEITITDDENPADALETAAEFSGDIPVSLGEAQEKETAEGIAADAVEVAEDAADAADDAALIALETLNEVRALREERNEQWQTDVLSRLEMIQTSLNDVMEEVQNPALSTAETLEIETPSEPTPEASDPPASAPKKARGKRLKW